MDIDWFQVSNPDVVDSPGLVVDVDRVTENIAKMVAMVDGNTCLLYTSPSPRDRQKSRMPSSA